MSRSTHPTILIAGASGGLGSTTARLAIQKGWDVIATARASRHLRGVVPANIPIMKLDLADAQSVCEFEIELQRLRPNGIEVVVNAVGADVRKPFESHSDEEIHRLTETNFIGPASLLRAALPSLKRSSARCRHFIQITGFMNARVAFPYYSYDVATRSAFRTLAESVQRELSAEGFGAIRLRQFCPAPAATESEAPFLPIWRQMGVDPVRPEDVAEALWAFSQRSADVGSMGRSVERAATLIDSGSRRLSDLLWLGRVSQTFKKAFGAI